MKNFIILTLFALVLSNENLRSKMVKPQESLSSNTRSKEMNFKMDQIKIEGDAQKILYNIKVGKEEFKNLKVEKENKALKLQDSNDSEIAIELTFYKDEKVICQNKSKVKNPCKDNFPTLAGGACAKKSSVDSNPSVNYSFSIECKKIKSN